MQTVGAFEAKTNLSDLLNKIEKGEQVVVTKHGRAIAKLVPMTNFCRKSTHDTIQQLKAFGKLNKLNGLNWKELRGQGRK